MAEPLKISVLDRTDTDDFEQLMFLLKNFTIDTYIRNKIEFSELRGSKRYELVNNVISEFEGQSQLSILTNEDIEQLKRDIDSQISSAKELIDKRKNANIETRYYVLKDGDKMVSFQQVQLVTRKEDNRIEGWRNLAYIEQEYAGENGKVIDSRGDLKNGEYSKIIYEDIGKWLEENGVNYERTCTGINMLPNISYYIRREGFLPFSKNEKSIFLEKFMNHKVDRTTLNRVYKLYRQHKQRTKYKNKDEILEEIQCTAEFGKLTEEQKKGLAKCFLKEEEKEFEIPNDKLEMLNGFIHENLRNRRNGTNYNLLHKISEMMTRELNVKDRYIEKIATTSTENQTKEVALHFFRSLDQGLYEKVKNIVEGNSEIDFNIYRLDKTEDFSKTKSDSMPVHTKTPCVISKDGKSAVYVPCNETLEDIYSLVHELSHTFDWIQNDNPTRNMLGEVTPHCFEAMLSKYLVKKGIATKEEVKSKEKRDIVSRYDDGVETFAKLELMKIKEQQGSIKQEDITNMQKKYGITNRQIGYVLGRLAQSEPNVDYRARYMIAQLVYPHYMEQYEQNPQNAIITMKGYFEQIKTNNFEGALETLGINPSINSIQELTETANRRIGNLNQIGDKMEDIEEFKRKKEILIRNRESALQRVEKVKEKYERIKSDDTIDRKELRLEIAKKTIQSKEYALERINNQLEFLRPSTQEDMDYRLKEYSEFSKQVKSEVPDDLHLCFHGCPIYAARQIIEDGEISSSVDRIGSETSYDVSDQVSVTTKNTIETTVQGYTGLSNYNLPAGCIFVILPKDENEITTSEMSMIISNVSFKENPERLYSIITTPENTERVTKWAEKANIDISKIHDFESFIQEIGKHKTQFSEQEIGKATKGIPTELKDKLDFVQYEKEEENRDEK